MAVVVFDSDVLIGFLNGQDAHHIAAVAVVRDAIQPGNRRLLCAVNYAEILIGPLRTGAQATVEQMLTRLAIEIIQVDMALAQHAGAVRARTNLKLSDAFALATAVHAEHRGWEDVTIASFDSTVLKAYADLHPT